MNYRIFFAIIFFIYAIETVPGGILGKKEETESAGLPEVPINLTLFSSPESKIQTFGKQELIEAYYLDVFKEQLRDLVETKKLDQVTYWKRLAAFVIQKDEYKSLRIKQDIKKELGITEDCDYFPFDKNKDSFYKDIEAIFNGYTKIESLYSCLLNWIKEELSLRGENVHTKNKASMQSSP